MFLKIVSPALVNQTLRFCCVVFYIVFFCFASFLIIVSDCISTCPLAFFSIVITIIKFNNKLVTINFESSKYKKDFLSFSLKYFVSKPCKQLKEILNTPSMVQ